MQFLNIFVVRRREVLGLCSLFFWSLVSFLCNSTAARGCRIGVGNEASPSLVPLQKERTRLTHEGVNSISQARSHGLPATFKQDGLVLHHKGLVKWSHECKVQEAERGFACWALKNSSPVISGSIDVSWWKRCNTPMLTGLCHHMVSTFQRWIIIPWEQEIPGTECHCGNGMRL